MKVDTQKLQASKVSMETNESGFKYKWEEYWKNCVLVDARSSPIGMWLRQKRLKILSRIFSELDSDMSVIDVGCGGGTTLVLIRKLGFKNSIGIDYVQASLDRCKALGFEQNKDVFLMDAGATTFPDQHFDIVFSEGLWEHFSDPYPYIAEAARISKRYIIVIQPEHYSPFGRLMLIGWRLFNANKGGVKEYSFRMSYFTQTLSGLGFEIVQTRSTILKEHMLLVYRRVYDE